MTTNTNTMTKAPVTPSADKLRVYYDLEGHAFKKDFTVKPEDKYLCLQVALRLKVDLNQATPHNAWQQALPLAGKIKELFGGSILLNDESKLDFDLSSISAYTCADKGGNALKESLLAKEKEIEMQKAANRALEEKMARLEAMLLAMQK